MTTFLLRLRNRHFLILDTIALAVTPSIALALRLDSFQALSRYAEGLLLFTVAGLAVRLLVFWRAGLYARYWRYASVDEIALIFFAVATATAINITLFILIPSFPYQWIPLSTSFPLSFLPFSLSPFLPRSIPLIDGMLTLIAIGAGRFSIRLAEHWHQRGRPGGKHALIIGAGDAGRMIVREMQNNPHLRLNPIGFIDDNPAKHGAKIHGVPVLGDRERLPEFVRDYKISQAIIAMPTASGKTIRRFVELCEEAGIQAKTIPGIYELLSGRVSVSQIRNVEIEDLLRREPVQIETHEVENMIRGKRVLVTGAGGSIGAEICRQVLQYGAAQLILLGHGENSIFKITRELRREENGKGKMEDGKGEEEDERSKMENGEDVSADVHSPSSNVHSPPSIFHSLSSIVPVIADIRDLPRLQTIFETYRPHIVFHAAAHKHVPLMENNAAEAVTNNVLGTKCLIEAAEAAGVDCFVLISTDKAVNPTSIMGVTKRVAEKLIVAAHDRQLASAPNLQLSNLQPSTHKPATRFTAVRFGNVLGSRGSVVKIFREQIARGGPVTVTHPDMRRYFMTIPEAVQLVLQAAAIGQGGEIFVLDMGDPVRIVDLARDLIELSGLEVGRDIDIEYTGVRPGEKLFEELFTEGEIYQRTHHEKIFVCRNGIVEQGNKETSEKGKRGGGVVGEGEITPEIRNPKSEIEVQVEGVVAAAQRGDADEARLLLQELVPEYQPVTFNFQPATFNL